jgi:hypothetical protein
MIEVLKKGNKYNVFEDNKLIKTFNCVVDLNKSLFYIKTINNLKSLDENVPIYKLYIYKKISLWAIIQFQLFEDLKILSKYHTLIDWLNTKKVSSISFDGSIFTLKQFITKMISDSYNYNQNKGNAKYFISIIFYNIILKIWLLYSSIIKKNILIYTPDIIDKIHRCDFRFYKVYKLMFDNNYKFYEVFHSTGLKQALKMRFRHSRINWHVESMSPYNNSTNERLPSFNDKELPLELKIWHSIRFHHFTDLMKIEKSKIIKYRKIIKSRQIDILIAMDDFRTIPSLVAAFKLENKMVVVIQHGLITEYHLGWINKEIPNKYFPQINYYFVHNEFWKNLLTRYNSFLSNNTLHVSGWWDQKYFAKSIKINGKNKTITILLLYETFWPSLLEIKQFVEKFTNDYRICIYFKVRPDISVENQVQDYFGGHNKPDKIITIIDENVINKIDVIVGSHSSLLYQLLIRKIPVLKIETSFTYGDQLISNKFATTLRLNDNFFDILCKVLCTSELELKNRYLNFNGSKSVPFWDEQLLMILYQFSSIKR